MTSVEYKIRFENPKVLNFRQLFLVGCILFIKFDVDCFDCLVVKGPQLNGKETEQMKANK